MFKFISKLPIGSKVAAGFLLCALLVSTCVFTTVYFVKKTEVINSRLVNLRIPTAQNTLGLLNGVNHSLAALRGWIILGKDKFKDQRATSWKNIDESLVRIDEYSKNWTNPENIKKANELKENFVKFKKYQKEIEDIAHSSENLPASKILLTEAAPKANIMLGSITNLINLEMKEPSSKERKEILGMMADVRGTTARALANIRAFLLSGDKVFQTRFNTMWTKNIKRVADLKSKKSLLSKSQLVEFNKYYNARNEFQSLPNQMFEIRNGDSWNLANKWLGTKAAPIAFKIKSTLNDLAINQNQLMVTDGKLSNELVNDLFNAEYFLLAFGIISCLLIGFYIYNSINNVLGEVTDKLLSGVNEVSELANKISHSSNELSVSSGQQASAMQETSSTMNEIEAMINRNTADSQNSSDIVSSSFEEVKNGVVKIKNMTKAISSINESNDKVSNQISKSNEKMAEIAAIIKTIGEKTQVINDIVFQTKLLSFNASVEAARAGEHGKGFAVVAEEVGNLATMSGKASSEIYEMLETSITSVEKVAHEQKEDMENLIKESRENIDKGITLGQDSEIFLEDLMLKMENLKDSVGQIALASEEQSSGVEEIAKAITEVNDSTRQNSSISSETAEISSDLLYNIENFHSVVEALSPSKKKSTQAIKREKKRAPNSNVVNITKEEKPVSVKKVNVNEESIPDRTDERFEDVV